MRPRRRRSSRASSWTSRLTSCSSTAITAIRSERLDYVNYSPLVRSGGLIAFHDIVPGPEEYVGGVPQFWQEVKEARVAHEFVESWSQGGLGIGVIENTSGCRHASDTVYLAPQVRHLLEDVSADPLGCDVLVKVAGVCPRDLLNQSGWRARIRGGSAPLRMLLLPRRPDRSLETEIEIILLGEQRHRPSTSGRLVENYTRA